MRCSTCSDVVKPVVAIDIDGTLGDYHGHFLSFAAHYLGRAIPGVFDGSMALNEHMGVSLHEYRTVKLAYRQGGMKRTMPVKEGAHEMLYVMNRVGAEIWLTTTRPYLRLDNVDPDTRHWLERNDLRFDYMLYDEEKYHMLLERVDKERIVFVLDDLAECYDEADALGLPVHLIRNPYNGTVRRTRTCSTLRTAASRMLDTVNKWKEQHGG